jgi:transposase
MITQKNISGKIELRKYFIGAHPIIQVYLERLKVREVIASTIKQDLRLHVPIEQTLIVMIHNILTSPTPMYEIGDWLAPIDKSTLGIDDLTLIQDDRVGKALESFYNGKNNEVFFRLALRAIKEFQIDCSQIHQDTTTITFSGKYSNWSASELLTYGKNKDHRPDLKQLVLGLSVTGDGAVPLVHKIYDGNQTDDTLHVENHQRIKKVLGRSDFIYVADCKLATEMNLRKISLCNGLFVSIMPRTWIEDSKFRDRIRCGEKIQWKSILKRKNNRSPNSKRDHYHVAEGDHSAKGYTIYWIHSSQKAECDADTRQRHIDSALVALRAIQSKLNKYSLKTEVGIHDAIEKNLQKYQCENLISCKIKLIKNEKIIFKKSGRPKSDQKGKIVSEPLFAISFELNNDAISKESLTDGIFPLITNVPVETKTPKEILEIYKYQAFLEKGHSKIKTWQEATPVLLKKSERVVAYLHLHVIALMVSSLIERHLRKAIEKDKIEKFPLYPEERHCSAPTLFDIVRAFRNVERYEIVENDKTTIFPAQLNKIQKQVLKLLEVPISRYQ